MIQLVRHFFNTKSFFILFEIDVLSDSDFQQTIRDQCHEYDALNWKPCSVVRYTSVIANRGIIKTKGFFIYAKRELRMP